MSKRYIVEVKELKKMYGTLRAVDGVSFKVKKAHVFGILGPNGAGKTTTLEMMEALREIDSGHIQIDGIDVKKQPRKVRKIIGLQLQSSSFFEKMTLSEQLKMFASFYGASVNPTELLKTVELEEKINSYPEQLSGGQRQRFSIAVALVNEPKVLFLDEPTTGLDPQSRRHLWDLVKQIQSRGITVILTTHYMEEAQTLCDEIAIMDNGKIIAQDSPQKLIKDLLKRGFKKAIEVEQADLEDVFIDLTGKALRD